jgi:agmatine deiminase
MINDAETDFLYLGGCLPAMYPEFYLRLEKLLSSYNISFDLLPNTKDIWARDYMPVQTGENEFIQFVYDPDYLKPKKYKHLKTLTDDVCEALDVPRNKSSLVVDGWNVIRNGDKVIMCDKVFKENPRLDRSMVIDELCSVFKTDKVYFVPWNRLDYTGHADGMVRFIDDNTVFVNSSTKDNPEHDRQLRKFLSSLGFSLIDLPYNPPYDPSYESAKGLYLNYLEMKQAVIVPIFKEKEDEIAIKTLEEVFRAKAVLSVDCSEIAEQGGVLNCISWSVARTW